MPTRVVTAARQTDGWYLTSSHDGDRVDIGFVPRLVDADTACAEFFAPDTTIDLRIATPRRSPRTAAPAPAPKHKARRGGSGRTRLR